MLHERQLDDGDSTYSFLLMVAQYIPMVLKPVLTIKLLLKLLQTYLDHHGKQYIR